jgi:hypothetical protein
MMLASLTLAPAVSNANAASQREDLQAPCSGVAAFKFVFKFAFSRNNRFRVDRFDEVCQPAAQQEIQRLGV